MELCNINALNNINALLEFELATTIEQKNKSSLGVPVDWDWSIGRSSLEYWGNLMEHATVPLTHCYSNKTEIRAHQNQGDKPLLPPCLAALFLDKAYYFTSWQRRSVRRVHSVYHKTAKKSRLEVDSH